MQKETFSKEELTYKWFSTIHKMTIKNAEMDLHFKNSAIKWSDSSLMGIHDNLYILLIIFILVKYSSIA